MNNNDHRKPFYNTTIPFDWEVKPISEVYDFINTPSFSRENLSPEKTETDLMYIHYGDIHSTFLTETLNFDIESRIPYLKDEYYSPSFNLLKEGDLVVADASEEYIGVGAAIEIKNLRQKKVIGGLHTIVLRSKDNQTTNGFNTYIFRIEAVHNSLKKIATGPSVYGITKGNLSKIKIPLPPLEEQRAIAKVLSTWDETIQKTEKLITQKELRKKWLMQQLLTGKKRLKGFSEEWKEIHIHDVAKEVSLRNKSDKQLTVLSCTKYDGLVPSLEYFGRKIFADDVSTYKIVPKNHFAYATNHIEEGSIGYQGTLDEALISPMYTVFKTDKSIDDSFFFKLLKSHPLVYQYQNRMEGSIDRRGGLRWDAFSIIKIKIPPLQEQTAIAQVLQTADKEITLLKAKAEKLREQKKGLMQVLLTGKKRLKINGVFYGIQ